MTSSVGTERAAWRAGWAVLATLLLAPLTAAAESPRTNLDVKSVLAGRPSSLRMRADAKIAALEADEEASASETTGPESERRPDPVLEDSVGPSAQDLGLDVAPPRGLGERMVFRFNIGFGIDGGQPACKSIPNTRDHRFGDPWQPVRECVPMASGAALDEVRDYARLRAYRFGDAVIGTRGLGVSSLSTYLAAGFRFNQSTGKVTTAVPSVHDANYVEEVLVRSGYAEVEGVFDNRWLKPVFLRAGRQFRYGAAVVHFDGLTAGYETRAFSAGFFSGRRVSLYGFEHEGLVEDGGLITGVSAKFDMFELKQVPLVISGSVLSFDGRRHFDGGMALRWSPEVLLRASVRMNGESPARQRLALRARISKVTTVSAEIENRAAGAWMYDLLIREELHDSTDPRRYLNMGEPRPRLYTSLRAGTVLLKNIDLLVRAGAAFERGDDEVNQASSYWGSYLEAGMGLEVRVRRAIAMGASFLARDYSLREQEELADTAGVADGLPANTGAIGNKSFMEGGFTLRFSQGRRTFGAAAELYARAYHTQSPYVPIEEDEFETRSGGRFSVDGWANQRTRMRVEYDVAFVPVHLAPELKGVKSLRVLAEGSF